ncbi:Probable leucine-rich repeat receptor-like protein kinase At5g49770 [Geodia barretti]|uniref:Probable leucine-rich repeat receptor-like protein kinase At5g49770 n=1 Tax=Geodia barretti TaxID=519541 RepID=A0AA35WSW5_GEOBA|nr:Probable leucine-rich repeat receptor-like protein kinase At5g49770 [Geodia barretti]
MENGQVYWFIAIAGRNLDGQQEWSLWSNWARAQPSGALSTEKAALVALYIATAGSNWIISANWLSDAPIGQWYGVTSDDHGRVVRLALAGNGLIGEIPPELVSLTNVTSLDLGRNGLTGNIPAGLSTLANLSILDLSDNQLTGEIPEALASLNSLTSLKLSRNFFTGCVPSRLRSIADNDLSELGLPVCDATTLPGAETIDFGTLENARYLERQMPRAAAAIKALPWVSDGIAASEKAAVQRLLYVAPFYPEVFNILIQWPWLRDGVNDVELSAINGIHAIAYYNEGIAVQFVQLPWLADGVSPMEGSAVRHISIIAQIDPTAAGRIIKMPFLATIDPPDVTALLSLTRLAHVAPQRFQYVMSHPALSAGITDDLARIVALLHGVNETNPSLIETLLDPDRVTVEERPVHLPLSGRVDLAIIRTRAGAELSMDLLEHSVQSAEALIGEPLPTNYVALLFENAKLRWSADALATLLAECRYRQGRFLGSLADLGFPALEIPALQTLVDEVVKTSEIEGEILDAAEVRSSLASRLGAPHGGVPVVDRRVDGVVVMMLDATAGFAAPLTDERLFGWHAGLFPTGWSGHSRITVGQWRPVGSGPMRVVSAGRFGREVVHFEAPAAERLPDEMTAFLDWFNGPSPDDPVSTGWPGSPLVRDDPPV